MAASLAQALVSFLLFMSAQLSLSAASEAADQRENDHGCTITASHCRNFPNLWRSQFRDSLGEEELRSASVAAACFKRAEDFYYWCGNKEEDADPAGAASVAATHDATATTQMFHAAACDRGWSLFDRWCYRHIWQQKNWMEAESSCRDEHEGNLISVHSAAENSFAHELTYGLSAWIGYHDVDKDTHYQWSDSTQDDFSNMAKNCTGRENEPDCTPEDKAKQWYNSKGDRRLTFVCKRNARLPVSLLTNVTAADLAKDWTKYAALVTPLPARDAAALPALKPGDALLAEAASGNGASVDMQAKPTHLPLKSLSSAFL